MEIIKEYFQIEKKISQLEKERFLFVFYTSVKKKCIN